MISGSQSFEVHSGSSLELGYLAGSSHHTRDSLAAGSSHQMVILSCTWSPDGKSRQLVVVVAFSAGCDVQLVETVVQVAVVSCR